MTVLADGQVTIVPTQTFSAFAGIGEWPMFWAIRYNVELPFKMREAIPLETVRADPSTIDIDPVPP